MYQIKYTCGYELQCYTRRDWARVQGPGGIIRFEGTDAAAQKWLADRGCRPCGN